MNSNLVHNLLNAAIVIAAAGTAALVASGCTSAATGALDCSQSFISPEYTAIAVSALGVLKLGINIVRDGFKGLTKKQPKVQ